MLHPYNDTAHAYNMHNLRPLPIIWRSPTFSPLWCYVFLLDGSMKGAALEPYVKEGNSLSRSSRNSPPSRNYQSSPSLLPLRWQISRRDPTRYDAGNLEVNDSSFKSDLPVHGQDITFCRLAFVRPDRSLRCCRWPK